MWNKLLEKLKTKRNKEQATVLGGVVLVVILTLWVMHRDKPENSQSETELGTTVPKGFLIVPLQLANAATMSALVLHNAVVDVHKPGQDVPLVENLRVIKLMSGDGPEFGALVPDKMAGDLQEALANPKLTAALRTIDAGPTRFHVRNQNHPLLTEIQTGGD